MTAELQHVARGHRDIARQFAATVDRVVAGVAEEGVGGLVAAAAAVETGAAGIPEERFALSGTVDPDLDELVEVAGDPVLLAQLADARGIDLVIQGARL